MAEVDDPDRDIERIRARSQFLARQLKHLAFGARRLRFLGFTICLLTLLNSALLFLYPTITRYRLIDPFERLGYLARFAIPISVPIVTIASVLGLALYEGMRKQGESLFEEVSDELHGHRIGAATPLAVAQATSAEKVQAEADLDQTIFRLRVKLRQFARASDLPLIPGKFGPAVYAVINLLIAVTLLFVSGIH